MGASTSRTPSSSKKLDINDILNEKEFIFLVLQTEIDASIESKNGRELYYIEKELDGHMKEIRNLVKHTKYENDILTRMQKLIYNYEMSIAKVRSILNSFSNNKVNTNSEVINERKDITVTTAKDGIYSPNTSIRSPTIIEKVNDKQFTRTNNDEMSPKTEEKDENSSSLIIFSDEDTEDEPTYANVENLKIDETEQTSLSKSKNSGEPMKHKPPVPVPRNKQESLIKDIPNCFMRLNEILEQEEIDSGDIEEVLNIRRKTNEIGKFLREKIDEIFKRYEDNSLERQNEERI